MIKYPREHTLAGPVNSVQMLFMSTKLHVLSELTALLHDPLMTENSDYQYKYLHLIFNLLSLNRLSMKIQKPIEKKRAKIPNLL